MKELNIQDKENLINGLIMNGSTTSIYHINSKYDPINFHFRHIQVFLLLALKVELVEFSSVLGKQSWKLLILPQKSNVWLKWL